ncbi:MAG: ribose 5-phosphate isomerase B [Candidatus Buchananbacteria bacterium]
MIYLGADHAGYQLKAKLKKVLEQKKLKFVDLGTNTTQSVDYPLVAAAVAKSVVKNKNNRGVLICGSGEGMEIAANKVKGARATPIYDAYTAKMSRLHNNANIASLRARQFDQQLAIKLVLQWLQTKFSGEARHRRRLAQIADLEK